MPSKAKTLPLSARLKQKIKSNPQSVISVRAVLPDSMTGTNRKTYLEEVKSMSGVKSFNKAGSLINFQIPANRVKDLPMPEGIRYGVPRRACTQQVMQMVNPSTGETVTATDGCQISDLKEQGWIPKSQWSPNGNGSGSNGGGGNGGSGGDDTSGQQAGFLTSGVGLALAGGTALILGMAVSGSQSK